MDKLPHDIRLWIDRGIRLGELCKRIATRARRARTTAGKTVERSLEVARDAHEPTPQRPAHGR